MQPENAKTFTSSFQNSSTSSHTPNDVFLCESPNLPVSFQTDEKSVDSLHCESEPLIRQNRDIKTYAWIGVSYFVRLSFAKDKSMGRNKKSLQQQTLLFISDLFPSLCRLLFHLKVF
ncbi:hypothetical protein CDAR_227181 [Caerostris darwini]|uniref:Uncharacterized protein n=1 Tax=Caerostris darwini TaxID=1538125 RepID=A0AAV4P9W9_9ARAC|nr:hypothetical protein CDAR_227181 [Caerostris darwini]